MDVQMDGWTDGRMDGLMDRWMDRQTDGWMDVERGMFRCMDGWWMGGLIDGLLARRMGE